MRFLFLFIISFLLSLSQSQASSVAMAVNNNQDTLNEMQDTFCDGTFADRESCRDRHRGGGGSGGSSGKVDTREQCRLKVAERMDYADGTPTYTFEDLAETLCSPACTSCRTCYAGNTPFNVCDGMPQNYCSTDCTKCTNGLCKACKSGFHPVGNSCVRDEEPIVACTTANCASCNSSGVCIKCNTNYTLTSTKQCKKDEPDTPITLGCQPGYGVSVKRVVTPRLQYNRFDATYEINPEKIRALEVSLNQTLFNNIRGRAAGMQTQTQFKRDDIEIFYGDPSTPVAPIVSCDTPCKTCNADGSCKTCISGFTLVSGACIQYQPYHPDDNNGGVVEPVDMCEKCPAGYYSAGGVNAVCQPCSAGTFSGEGASKCTACADGTFSYQEGATSCQSCSNATDKCNECTSVGVCTECSTGYTVSYTDSGAAYCKAKTEIVCDDYFTKSKLSGDQTCTLKSEYVVLEELTDVHFDGNVDFKFDENFTGDVSFKDSRTGGNLNKGTLTPSKPSNDNLSASDKLLNRSSAETYSGQLANERIKEIKAVK